MSPSTSMCCMMPKSESRGDLGVATTRGSKKAPKLGTRKQESRVSESAPLKVSRESHRIRKQPLPLPQVQYRPPIIIHTYSPKVIHTQPDGFMSLVQKLTGSSDTRLRLKRKPAEYSSYAPASSQNDRVVDTVVDLEQQGSKTTTAQCASPSSSDEDSSSFLASDACGGDGLASMKQSHDSPRSPFEFVDNHDLMFTLFVDASPINNSLFSSHVNAGVKAEPSFSFNDNNSFNNFFTESPFNSQPPTKGSSTKQEYHSPFHSAIIDINAPLPTQPGFLNPPSAGSIAGLPDLSPASANWSCQSFLDCLITGGPSSSFTNHNGNHTQILRQRFSGVYAPSPEGTMVALENIQAFMLS